MPAMTSNRTASVNSSYTSLWKGVWLKDSEVLKKDYTQTLHKLKKLVYNKVILIKATLRLKAPARTCLKV